LPSLPLTNNPPFLYDVPQVATKITVDKYDGRKTKNSSLSL
jgi:hypothetical protein